MSVTTVTLDWVGQTGARRPAGEVEYTAQYKVTTDDKNDGPAIVMAASGLPASGSSYSFGNDSDPAATLKSLVPSRLAPSRTEWIVTATWDNKTDDASGTDDGDNPTDDPLLFRDTWSISTAKFQVPVEAAILHTNLDDRGIGDVGPIKNTACDTYRPPPERDESRISLRITRNLVNFPWTHLIEYQDVVNSDAVQILKNGLNVNITARTMKLETISGGPRRLNDIDYVEATYEFLIIDENVGIVIPQLGDASLWRIDVLDRGVKRRSQAGDPDGRGSTYTSAQIPSDSLECAQIKDLDGVPISEPVNLDGHGQPAKLNPQAAGGEPFYMRYQIYKEKPYAVLNIWN